MLLTPDDLRIIKVRTAKYKKFFIPHCIRLYLRELNCEVTNYQQIMPLELDMAYINV